VKPTLVIYEDKELRRENFGPHRLMMALAFDVEQTNGTRREVFEASFRAFPRGGADKVVDMICGEPPTEAADTARGASVIALLDSDHLVDMLLRRFKGSYADLESARADLEQRARSQTPGVSIRLVDTNIEWVCEQLVSLDPTIVPASIARQARTKDRASRDELLRQASLSERAPLRAELMTAAPLLRAARDCLVACFRNG
jgi:hypothetical protein